MTTTNFGSLPNKSPPRRKKKKGASSTTTFAGIIESLRGAVPPVHEFGAFPSVRNRVAKAFGVFPYQMVFIAKNNESDAIGNNDHVASPRPGVQCHQITNSLHFHSFVAPSRHNTSGYLKLQWQPGVGRHGALGFAQRSPQCFQCAVFHGHLLLSSSGVSEREKFRGAWRG